MPDPWRDVSRLPVDGRCPVKRLALIVLAVGAFAGCNSGAVATTGNVIGLHDIVLLDDPPGNGQVASLDGDGGVVGLPRNLMFATSADTNEVRVLRMFNGPTGVRHQWQRAPNPLETLSIPTLERPTLLATDIGINGFLQRVTSTRVYASRPGAREISIVSVALMRQLARKPMPIPGPLTAMAGLMQVGAGNALPPTTALYFATWDGERAELFRTEVSTDDALVEPQIVDGTSRFESVELIDGAAIATLYALIPLSTRTVDGAPFCASETCLVVAIKPSPSAAGRTYVLEPSTGRRVSVAFPGPVREVAAPQLPGTLYGVLDEAACGGVQCAGIVGADLTTGTSAGGFPRLPAIPGPVFGPLNIGPALITGLDIAQNVDLQQTTELLDGDAGTTAAVNYREVGVFTTSDGYLNFFDSFSGGLIDYDARRSRIVAATERLPVILEDGGASLFSPDGGEIGQIVAATVSTSIPVIGGVEQPYRVSTIIADDGTPDAGADATWTFDVSDGYFYPNQTIVISNRGQIPGLAGLSASGASGVQLPTGGYEVRAVVGDRVQLAAGDVNDGGLFECGRASVVAIGAGFVEIDAIPPGCAGLSRFSVLPGDSRSLVVTGSVDGYLGRSDPGATFTYDKPLVAFPPGVSANRTALTITMAKVPPPGDGAYMSFALDARIAYHRYTLDTVSSSVYAGALTDCSSSVPAQIILGRVVASRVPIDASNSLIPTYVSRIFTAVQSGDAILEVQPGFLFPPSLLANSDLGGRSACYR